MLLGLGKNQGKIAEILEKFRNFLKKNENPGRKDCYYHPQTKFAKVMFLQVSVCPQGGHAWQGGCAWWGCVWQGGVHGRGHAWQGVVW